MNWLTAILVGVVIGCVGTAVALWVWVVRKEHYK